jgi:hypothetical protein
MYNIETDGNNLVRVRQCYTHRTRKSKNYRILLCVVSILILYYKDIQN